MHADADLGRAGDQEQNAVKRNRHDGCDERKEQRRDPEDDQKHAEGGDGRPFFPQALDCVAEIMRVPDVRHVRHCLSPGSEDEAMA